MTRHKEYGDRPISTGRNDSRSGLLLRSGEVVEALNVDMDRESLASSKGSIKFGNQVAPSSAVETRVDSGFSRMPILPGKSAPMRGYVYIPYDERQDLGAVQARADLDLGTVGAGLTVGFIPTFHAQRGRSFELCFTFRLPAEERLYDRKQAALYNPSAGWATRLGSDIALDEFSAIIQKGGDKIQPMSWAIGIVNTGALFDTAVNGDGTNIFGINPSVYADRESDYALCLVWLDAPKWGEQFPSQMRYRLNNGQISGHDHSTGNDPTLGRFCTHAYRALVIPKFIEPGRDYSVSVQLRLDTGSAGSGTSPTTSWVNNGYIRATVMSDGRRTAERFAYEHQNPGSATIYRYKGPGDSAEYLTKYGFRWSGRDPMYIGLGFRYAPWAAAGFVPFGIDSAPLEKGGMRMTDHSLHVPSVYSESTDPAATGGSGGPTYNLRVARDTTLEPSGSLIDVSDRGMVYNLASYAGVVWGAATNQWEGISPFGRSPLGGRYGALSVPTGGTHPGNPFDEHWRGLGGSRVGSGGPVPQGVGFNPEALRGYRLVLAPDSSTTGFSGVGASGALISIHSYVPSASASGIYPQHITSEGSLSPWLAGPPSFSGLPFRAYIRAFRWNQRPVAVSDVRIYSAPRDHSLARVQMSLLRFPDIRDAGEPGIESLVGSWRLDEGGHGSLVDQIGGNSAFPAPYAMPKGNSGTEGQSELFLSGDGEALRIDFSSNPFLRELLADVLSQRKTGFAVELTCRIPEASYGIPAMLSAEAGVTSTIWTARMGSPLISWDTAAGDGEVLRVPARQLLEFGQLVRLTGLSAGAVAAGAMLESPFAEPLSFDARVLLASDQEGGSLEVPSGLQSWVYSAGGPSITPRWRADAAWVGKTVTFQVGVQHDPTGGDFSYTAYIAASPIGSLSPGLSGGGGEFALVSAVNIDRRGLERSVVTIGGTQEPVRRTYFETSARVLIDKVRVYGTTAPGVLPGSTGGAPPAGAGKIHGGQCLPQRKLSSEDILRQISGVSSALDLTRGLRTAAISGGGAVQPGGPESSIDAIDRSFISIDEDPHVISRFERSWDELPKVYFVSSVLGQGIQFSSPYFGPTRKAAAARSFRLIAYCAFDELDQRESLDRPLILGGGGYDNTLSGKGVAGVTRSAFASLAPTGVSVDVRTISPLSSGRPGDIFPRWVRGMKSANDNPILGLGSLNERLYASVRGALYEVDDRWRSDGPSSELRKSFAFRSTTQDSGIPRPEAMDMLEEARPDLDISAVLLPGGGAARTMLWDCWVYLDEYGTFQTIQWYGHNRSPKAQWWLRLDRGYPELVISSSDSGILLGSTPRDGYFVARGGARVPLREWTHIRWTITVDSAASQGVRFPRLTVQGKRSAVTVSDTGTSAPSGTWLSLPTVYMAGGGASGVSRVGCARALRISTGSVPVALSPQNVAGQDTDPVKYQGYIDALGGRMAYLANVQLFTGGPFATGAIDFDPFTSKYGPQDVRLTALFAAAQQYYGYGHKVLDDARNVYVEARSSPFVSLWHRMGRSQDLASFANHGPETFVANGTRVTVIDSAGAAPGSKPSAREAGVVEPSGQPQVSFIRQPIFRKAVFDFGGNPENDPIIQRQTQDPLVARHNYIIRNPGTFSTTQNDSVGGSLVWETDKYFAFKGLFRPDRVEGRVTLFSRRGSASSGLFVEIRDGRCVLGWYDMSLKKEVTISTSQAVFKPGFWHYIYIRKWFPRAGLAAGATRGEGSAQSSNWQNAIFDQTSVQAGEAIAHDMMVVRRIPKAAQGDVFDAYTGFDAKAFRAYPGGGAWSSSQSSPRSCVSFTIDQVNWSTLGAGHTVTISGIVASFATSTCSGTTITTASAGTQKFLLDHEGMLCQFSQGPLAGVVFRIVEVLSVSQIRVVGQNDASPGFTAGQSAGRLVIATGVSLVKSEDFDSSTAPDSSDYGIEVFSDALAANPLSGIQPFVGDHSSFAFVATAGRNYLSFGLGAYGSPDIFENALGKLAAGTIVSGNEIGTDAFGDNATNYAGTQIFGLPYQGCPIQRLAAGTPDYALSAVDCRLYAQDDITLFTNQPNAATGVGGAEPGLIPGATQSSSTENFTFVRFRVTAAGQRRVLITFYDPENDTESYPNTGPDGEPDPVIVDIGTEERENPSGSIELIVSSWPKPVEDRRILLRVYVSTLGTLNFYRAAEVDANRSGSIHVDLDDVLLATGAPLQLLAGAPPECRIVTVVGSAVVYGNLHGDEDSVAHSLPGFPESVPPSFLNSVSSGYGQGITGLAELGGYLVAMKRSSIYVGQIVDSLIAWKQITMADGCVSHATVSQLEDRVHFLSGRGPMVILPGEPLPVPFYIGTRCRGYFLDELDGTSLPRSCAVLYRRRGQYIFTTKDSARTVADTRIGIEFDHPLSGPSEVNEMVAGHRFSRYQGPALTRISTVVPSGGGSSRLVGGTLDGFVIWLDAQESPLHMLGPSGPVGAGSQWGSPALVGAGGGVVTGAVDLAQEGPRGAPVRWTEAGNDREGYVLLVYESSGQVFMVIRTQAGGSPITATAAAPVVVGGQRHLIRTREYDAETPHIDKEVLFLDISKRPTGGALVLDCYRQLGDAPVGSLQLDLSKSFQAVNVGMLLKQTRACSFGLRTDWLSQGISFELLDLVLRWAESDNR